MSTPPDKPQITEERSPGNPMQPLNLKLPPDALKMLRSEARRLCCYPSALGRHLIIRGLQEMKDREA